MTPIPNYFRHRKRGISCTRVRAHPNLRGYNTARRALVGNILGLFGKQIRLRVAPFRRARPLYTFQRRNDSGKGPDFEKREDHVRATVAATATAAESS